MSLAHPEAVGALAVAWLALAGAVLAARQLARRRLRRLVGGAARPGLRSDALLLAAAALVALAWLGPEAGSRTVQVPASGIDVAVLVDVSRSMDARDAPPSRMARARRAAAQALRGLRAGDRAALAVFAGHGALLTPLTPDKRALAEMAAALDTDLMSDRGSEGDAGVARALEAFDPASLRPRVLLVLSDGEAAGLGDDAVARARDADVRVVTALFGSEDGATIPTGRGVLEDARGEPVRTFRRREAAAALAAATDGAVLEAGRFGALDPERLLAAVRAGAVPTAEGTLARQVPVARYAWPALLALLLLVAEALPERAARRLVGGPRRRSVEGRAVAPRPGAARTRRAGAAAATALLLLAAAGAGAPGAAAEDAPPAARARVAAHEAAVRARPEAADRLVALGVARAQAGDLDGAERALAAGALRAEDRSLAATAYYDLGVAALARRDWAAARDAFLDALAMDPGDARAKHNLEWALRALEAREPPPGAGEDGEEETDAAPRPPEDARAEREQREDGPPAGRGATEPSRAEPRPAPAEPGEDDPAAGRGADAPPALDAAEAARWLEAVRDDPGRALRRAAAGSGDPAPSRGPRW